MLNKIFMLIPFVLSVSFAEITDNWNGYRDTSNITDFRADSSKYSKAFNLSGYENLIVDVLADDSTAANLSSDSIKFYWWIEFGHIALSKTNTKDTAWDIANPVLVDTFDILTAANRVITFRSISTDYSFPAPVKTIDTASITGFASQRRYIIHEADQFFRIGHKGLTGNNKDAPLVLRDNVWRRAFGITRGR